MHAAASHAVDAPFESEPTLPAAELVAPSLLAGPGFQVAPQAEISGYQARFVLRTDHGEIEVHSVELLAERVAEMPAVQALHAVELQDAVTRGMADEAGGQLRALERIVHHPVRTLTEFPAGVRRFFERRVRRLGERIDRLGDRAWRGLAHEGDPYGVGVDPLHAPRDARPESPRPWYAKPGRELRNLVRGELAHGRARRHWAMRLGIDPETGNPLIAPRLDVLAWISAGAARSTALALSGLPGNSPEILAAGTRVHDAVWTLDPPELRARSRARLSTWCHDETLLRAFLRHRPFSAERQTRLVESVRRLEPAHGCDALLDIALMAGNELEARFVVNVLALLEHHLGASSAGGTFEPFGATVLFRSAAGETVLALPVDVLSWTGTLRQFFDSAPLRVTPRTLLVSGRVSDRALHELTRRGWSVVPHQPYSGTSAYPAPVRTGDAGASPARPQISHSPD